MPATIAYNGFGRVATGDSLTGWTAFKISGTGGGPSIATADGQIEGTGAVTAQVSRQKVVIYFDIGAGNELDFSGGGAQEGQAIFIWWNFLAAALLLNRASGGIQAYCDSSAPTTSRYKGWNIEGADTYAGGWDRPAIWDPTTTPTEDIGAAMNLASVRYFGIIADVGGTTARFDNLIVDAIDVGFGLRVFGTSETDDLKGDLLADEATNRYRVFTALNKSENRYQLSGRLDLGDNVGTNAADLTDVSANIALAEPTYFDGSAVVPSLPLDFFSINCVGNGVGSTSIQIGKKVGTGDAARGRSGWVITGNQTYNLGIDWDDGNVNQNRWYGCTFERLSGTLSWGSNAAHECIGNIFDGGAQFDPVGGIQIRACFFQNYAGTLGALLWNASINIKNSNFISNTDGTNDPAAIEVPGGIAGPISSDGLIFSGNDFDYYWRATTGTLTVNAINGANPGTWKADGTATVAIQNAVSVTFSDAIIGSHIFAEATATVGSVTVGDVLINDTISVNPYVYAHNYEGDLPFRYHIRNSPPGGPFYEPFDGPGTISAAGFSQIVSQEQEAA